MAKSNHTIIIGVLFSAAVLFAVAGSGCSKKQAAQNPPVPPPAVAAPPQGGLVPSVPGVVGDPRSNVATPDVIARQAKNK